MILEGSAVPSSHFLIYFTYLRFSRYFARHEEVFIDHVLTPSRLT